MIFRRKFLHSCLSAATVLVLPATALGLTPALLSLQHKPKPSTGKLIVSQEDVYPKTMIRALGMPDGEPYFFREASVNTEAEIRTAIEGTHLVLIAAGMGRAAGAGGVPLIGRIAKEMGILTLAVVTKQFAFEGAQRMNQAMAGLANLDAHVDSLIEVSNEKMLDLIGNDATQANAFSH